jgi:predicted nucleotidyltransferase
MQLKFFLESLLGWNVDLVTPRAIKPRIRPQIEREAVHVT